MLRPGFVQRYRLRTVQPIDANGGTVANCPEMHAQRPLIASGRTDQGVANAVRRAAASTASIDAGDRTGIAARLASRARSASLIVEPGCSPSMTEPLSPPRLMRTKNARSTRFLGCSAVCVHVTRSHPGHNASMTNARKRQLPRTRARTSWFHRMAALGRVMAEADRPSLCATKLLRRWRIRSGSSRWAR